MARGGLRVGAGRPKKGETSAASEAEAAVVGTDMTPLDYMLMVMRDAEADPVRRDRMAVAAAPYVHGKAPDAPAGKKEQRQKAAEEKAASGSKFAPPAPPRVVVNNG